jgi:hypothetical protein
MIIAISILPTITYDTASFMGSMLFAGNKIGAFLFNGIFAANDVFASILLTLLLFVSV